MNVQNFEVRTPLGRGKVVWTFPDGTFAVEFRHGGGQIFLPGDPDVVVDSRTITVEHAKRTNDWTLCG